MLIERPVPARLRPRAEVEALITPPAELPDQEMLEKTLLMMVNSKLSKAVNDEFASELMRISGDVRIKSLKPLWFSSKPH